MRSSEFDDHTIDDTITFDEMRRLEVSSLAVALQLVLMPRNGAPLCVCLEATVTLLHSDLVTL